MSDNFRPLSPKPSLLELKAQKYAQLNLPLPDVGTLNKYFTETAQEEYHLTYKKLLHQAELLPGGKRELLATVRASKDPVFPVKKADEKLVKWGVVTPDIRSASATPTALRIPQRPKTSQSFSMPVLVPINNSQRPYTADQSAKPRPLLGRKAFRPKTAMAIIAARDRRRAAREQQQIEYHDFEDMDSLNGDSVGEIESKELSEQMSETGSMTLPTIVTQQNNFFNTLDDDSGEETDRNNTELVDAAPASPRRVFLAGCVRYGLPPRSVAMLRKRISPILNVAHMSIGNQTAILLAEALDKMPYLQALNLADNNLDDVGLSAIIRSIAKHSTLEVLDISQNIMDDDASKALAAYIGTEECQLKCLRMSSTDIDDKECARFVDVLMNNRQLRELDMSNNLLGKDENLNVVMPDFLTGGESIAKLLRSSLCPLETLNLHWNMIRLEGASTLCDSIRHNSYLTHLDLSYNALGSAAVCVLGVALTDNTKLRHLNLASNNIDSMAALTLAIGMRENRSLREVILSGNPIGEQGARALMKVVLQEGQRLRIQTQDCDVTAKPSATASKLRIDNPIGDYLLNLSEPFERAIAFELFDIIANESFIDVSICDLYLSSSSSSSLMGHSDAMSLAGGGASVVTAATKKSKVANGGSVVGDGGGGSSGGLGGGKPLKKGGGGGIGKGYDDSLHMAVERLGPLTASYVVVRFDEAKPHASLTPDELAEERFFLALAPICAMERMAMVKIVKRRETNRSGCFPVACLRVIFDELLRDSRTAAPASASTATSTSESLDSSLFLTTDVDVDDDNDDEKAVNAAARARAAATAATAALSAHDAMVRTLCRDAHQLLDPRNAGVIDTDIFIDYIVERARGAKERLRQIRNTPRCAAILKTNAAPSTSSATMKRPGSSHSGPPSLPIDRTSLVRYVPPIHGWLRLRLTESFMHHADTTSSTTASADGNEATTTASATTADSTAVSPVATPAATSYAMTRNQCQKLLDEVTKMCKSNPITLLLYAIDNAWLRLEEAQQLYAFAAKKADDPTLVLARILLRMQSGYEARQLVHYCLGDDILKLRRLKQRLGSVYHPLLQIYSGYFTLDLSNELDRMCLKRLLEKSVRDNAARRAQGLWDTSQYGNWSCFRNEVHRSGIRGSGPSQGSSSGGGSGGGSGGNGGALGGATAGDGGAKAAGSATTNGGGSGNDAVGGTSGSGGGSGGGGGDSNDGGSGHGSGGGDGGSGGGLDIDLANVINGNLPTFANVWPEQLISPAAFAANMPTRGRLEFDFVDLCRPDVRHCHAVADDAIVDCLLLSRLLTEDEVPWAVDRLRAMQATCRRNWLPENATNVYRQDLGRAVAVNDHLHVMYNTLALRGASRKKAFLREAIATQATPLATDTNTAASGAQSTSSSSGGGKTRGLSRKQQQQQPQGQAQAAYGATKRSHRAHKRKSVTIGGGGGGGGGGAGGAAHGPTLATGDDIATAAAAAAAAINAAGGGGPGSATPSFAEGVDDDTLRAVRETVQALQLGGDSGGATAAGAGAGDGAGASPTGPPAPMLSSQQRSFNHVHESFTGHAYMNSIDQDIAQDALRGFRSFIKQGSRAANKLRQWGQRMQDIVRDGRGSDEHKSAALLEFFELELSHFWLECRQLALILDVFGSVGRAARSNLGSYRVELVVILFDRLVDLWHADLLWQVLSAEEQAALFARIGVLNWFSTSRVAGGWSYDLSRWEERQCLKLHIDLSFTEPLPIATATATSSSSSGGSGAAAAAAAAIAASGSSGGVSSTATGPSAAAAIATAPATTTTTVSSVGGGSATTATSTMAQPQWGHKVYHFVRGIPPVPAWTLNRNWLTEESLPMRGIVTFDMTTGDAAYGHIAPPDVRLRQMLGCLTLPGPRPWLEEIDLAVEKDAERVAATQAATQALRLNTNGDYDDPLDRLLVAKPPPSSSSTTTSTAAKTTSTTTRFLPPLMNPSATATTATGATPTKSILKASGGGGGGLLRKKNVSLSAQQSPPLSQRVVPIRGLERLRSQRDLFVAVCPHSSSGSGSATGHTDARDADIANDADVVVAAEGGGTPVTPSSPWPSSRSRPTTATTAPLAVAAAPRVAFHVQACNQHVARDLNGQWTYSMAPRPPTDGGKDGKHK